MGGQNSRHPVQDDVMGITQRISINHRLVVLRWHAWKVTSAPLACVLHCVFLCIKSLVMISYMHFSGQIVYKNFKFIFNLCKWTETDTCSLTFHFFFCCCYFFFFFSKYITYRCIYLLLNLLFFSLLLHDFRVAAKCERGAQLELNSRSFVHN